MAAVNRAPVPWLATSNRTTLPLPVGGLTSGWEIDQAARHTRSVGHLLREDVAGWL